MRYLLFLFLVVSPLMPAQSAMVSSNHNTDMRAERGLWFYEKPAPEEKKKKAVFEKKTSRKPLGPLPPYRKLMDMHPDDLKKVYQRRIKEAVWRPTPQNMYAYMIVKDIARRKALAFTQVHSYMLLKAPQLNINALRPVSDFARDTQVRQMSSEVRSSLRAEKDRFALLYFRSKTCVYCSEQDGVLKYFRVRTGWKVKVLDINENPAIVHKLQVRVTPTIFLIQRGSDDYMPVAVGPTASMTLEENIFRAMRMLRGDITPSQFFMYEFDRGGLLDPAGDPTENVDINDLNLHKVSASPLGPEYPLDIR